MAACLKAGGKRRMAQALTSVGLAHPSSLSGQEKSGVDANLSAAASV